MTPPAEAPHLGLVVEGRGEMQAVPLLLRRGLSEREVYGDLIGRPVPCNGRENALKPKGLEGKVAVAVCLADGKYEDWLVASAESLHVPGLTYRPDQDSVKVLKEALHPSKYVKPSWQPRLSQHLDFELASERNASLARFLAQFDLLIDRHFGEGSSAEP